MSLMDFRNDLAYDIRRYAIKKVGKWWSNNFFVNKEVKELERTLWKELETFEGALGLSNKIR